MEFKLEENILSDRPYTIFYMMQSLDGSSYGDWSQHTIETFKQCQTIEPSFKANAIINGSSTMEKLTFKTNYPNFPKNKIFGSKILDKIN